MKSTLDVWQYVHGWIGKPRYHRNHTETETLCTGCSLHASDGIVLWCRLLTLIFAGTDAEARPGVMRLIDEAREAGIKVAVCSAATKSSVIHVVKSLLGDERFEVTTSFSCVYASQHLLSEILFAVTQRC